MFLEERQDKILELLKEKSSVRVVDLVESFRVTRETIRKDLYELEKKGIIKKVHGGAVINKTDLSNVEPSYSKRSSINLSEKEWIARRAAACVEDGDTLYIDIGTTTLLFAKQLKMKKDITVITNSVLIAVELGNYPEIKVILSGGELRAGELSLSGEMAIQSLNRFYIDKAFIGVGGLAEESGFTDYNIAEAEVRKLMLTHAKERYALVDHSKMHITAFIKIANVNEIDVVVTDRFIPADIMQILQDQGVEVVIAEE